MTKKQYEEITAYMEQCMADAAHDREHVWRVLGYALRLARRESTVDYDLLIAACLLHDIGRPAQFRDPSLDHAAVGADMAAQWLSSHGWGDDFAQAVKTAIRSHRWRTGGRAETLEAQILFDADKLEVSGMMGLFRTIAYCNYVEEPFYTVDQTGQVEFTADAAPSVFQEYLYKLRKVKERFYTQAAREIADQFSRGMDVAVTAALEEVSFARGGLDVLQEPGLLS